VKILLDPLRLRKGYDESLEQQEASCSRRKKLLVTLGTGLKKLEQQKDEILDKNKELKKQYENLDMLSKIGRDITANITVESLLESVYKKLNSLMDASIMGFGIIACSFNLFAYNELICIHNPGANGLAGFQPG